MLSGDTRIRTVFYGDVPVKKLKPNTLIYSWDVTTKLPVLKILRGVSVTSYEGTLVDVLLDSDSTITCDSEHSFYTFRGSPVRAIDLSIGQSIRAFSMSIAKDGHIRVHGWVDGKARHQYEARMVWEYHNGPVPDNLIIHHIDFTKLNNTIENLELLTNSEHNRVHYPERQEKGFNHKVLTVTPYVGKMPLFSLDIEDNFGPIIIDSKPVSGFCSGVMSM